MDFSLTAEQREIQELAREVAEREIAPHAATWDRDHTFPRALFSKLGELGLMGVCVSEELGGAGADFLSYILVLEELSRADAGVGVTVAVHTSAATLPIIAFGTPAQRDRFVPELAAGRVLGAFALTEPGSGSDAGSLRTAATRNGDGWTITGSKQWITNGSHAGTFLVFARTDAAVEGPRGVSAFLVDGSDVEVTREEEKLGLNSSSTADIRIADAFVGQDGCSTSRVVASRWQWRRWTVAGSGSPPRRWASRRQRTTWRCATRRNDEQFGSRIADFQAIQFKLADMATEIDAARMLTYRAAWLKQEGRPHTLAGAQAKLFASAVARRQTGEAIQVLGGYGYTKEFPVERYYRDAKITEIYEGTSEIQRIVIARHILAEQDDRAAAGAPTGLRVGWRHVSRCRRTRPSRPDLHPRRRRRARPRSVTARASRSSIRGSAPTVRPTSSTRCSAWFSQAIVRRRSARLSAGSRTSCSTSAPTSVCRSRIEGRLRVDPGDDRSARGSV